MPFLRFLMLLSLVAWIGGLVFFAFVLAPTVFAHDDYNEYESPHTRMHEYLNEEHKGAHDALEAQHEAAHQYPMTRMMNMCSRLIFIHYSMV